MVKVDRQKQEVCSAIHESFKQLKAVMDQKKISLVKTAGSLAQEKKEVLVAQRGVLQEAQEEVQLLLECVKKNVENTSDQDLMRISTQLHKRIEEEEKRHQQLSLEPAATADIACTIPHPTVLPSDFGSVQIAP